MDGFEATKILQSMKDKGQIDWSMRIILLSAFTSPADREYALKVGCDEYWSKPIGINKIRQIISRL